MRILTASWKPLQWFSWEPERRRDTNTRLYMTVMNGVRKRMEEGTQIPCTTQWALERQKELNFDDLELSYALSSPWAAGIGTVSTAIEIAVRTFSPKIELGFLQILIFTGVRVTNGGI